MKLILSLVGFILLVPSIILNLYFFHKLNNNVGVLVLEVLDGDTILLEQKVSLRLRHIDAPELKYCGGVQAKEELTRLVKNKRIIIEEQLIDQYGRPMALIYDKNQLINQKMLESGFVRYHSDNSSKSKILEEEAGKAKNKKIGIFKMCQFLENINQPKCNIKGNIDKNKSSDNRKYYLPGCAQYKFTIIEKDLGEDFFCTEKEAQKAGFVKALTCN